MTSPYQVLSKAAERAENLLRLQQIERIVAEHPEWVRQDDRLQHLVQPIKRTA